MTNIISFPGLGIDEFSLNTVAFTIFGRDIAWYGIIITLGIIAGFSYVLYRSKFEGISSDDIMDLAIYVIITAIVGARVYYVAMRWESYDSFLEMIAIWNGGIAIYGAIIGGGLAAFVVAKVKKIKFTKFFDMLVPGVMLGQIIGRWGNFVNAEAHGGATSLPWRMGLHQVGRTVYEPAIYVHPTFLYESLWNLIGFLLINAYYKKKSYDGQIFLMYITWYGLGRMFIEGLRTDSLMIGDFRASQMLAAASVLFGIVMLIVCGIIVNKRANQPAVAGDAGENAETDTADLSGKTEEKEEEKEDSDGSEENH